MMRRSGLIFTLLVAFVAVAVVGTIARALAVGVIGVTPDVTGYQQERDALTRRSTELQGELATLPAANAYGSVSSPVPASESVEAAATKYLSSVRDKVTSIGAVLTSSQFAFAEGQEGQGTARIVIRLRATQATLVALSVALEQGDLPLRFEAFEVQRVNQTSDGAEVELAGVLMGEHKIAP